MANITNASAVYVAVGGGGTPLEIYNKQNQWNPLSYYFNSNYWAGDITSVYCAYQDNGNGTISVIAKADGNGGNRFINLPNGYVMDGDQVVDRYGFSDGSSIISINGGQGFFRVFKVRKTS